MWAKPHDMWAMLHNMRTFFFTTCGLCFALCELCCTISELSFTICELQYVSLALLYVSYAALYLNQAAFIEICCTLPELCSTGWKSAVLHYTSYTSYTSYAEQYFTAAATPGLQEHLLICWDRSSSTSCGSWGTWWGRSPCCTCLCHSLASRIFCEGVWQGGGREGGAV